MYNEKQKLAYIDDMSIRGSSASYITAMKRFFNLSESYEYGWGKDLCEFTKDELLSSFLQWDISYGTAVNYVSIFKGYTVTYNPTNPSLFQLKSAEIKELFPKVTEPRKPTNIRYSTIAEAVHHFENPVDQFLLLGLYSGIKGRNYCELSRSSMEHSDSKTNMIWLAREDGEKVELTYRKFYAGKELFDYAKAASEAVNYVQVTAKGKRLNILQSDGQLIFKRVYKTYDKPIDSSTIAYRVKSRLKTIIGKAGLPETTTPVAIYKSGLVYTIQKTGMDRGIMIDKIEEIEKLPQDAIQYICTQYNLNCDEIAQQVEGYF